MASLPTPIANPVVAEAELVERRMATGRNEPIALHARAGGSLIHCVVKPTNKLTTPPVEYLCEWLASALALTLGVPTPCPHQVRIDLAFVGAVADEELRSDLRLSLGLVFGSEYHAGDTQFVTGLVLSPEQKRAAAQLLAFDLFIHNVDRRAEKPNMFANRAGFTAYDHEQAFAFLFPLIGSSASPATDPAIDIVQKHAFRHAFGRAGPDFSGFLQALAGLTDPVLDAIAASVPPEWEQGAAAGKLTQIMEVLRERRDTAEEWLPLSGAGVTR